MNSDAEWGNGVAIKPSAPREALEALAGRPDAEVAAEKQPTKVTPNEQRLIEARAEILGEPPRGSEIAYLHAVLAQVGLPGKSPKARVFERTAPGVSLRLEAGALWGGDEH